ncbi:MAG TPA: Ig-like domain-containing protein, partial [Pyrinomonadaceae bacterium]|nr:Ig-like domain-containing protein [Pyrinomonadaceae bacterium]
MKLKPSLALILIWMILLPSLPQTSIHLAVGQEVDKAGDSNGLRFRLSEGTENVGASAPSPTVAATATALSEADTNKLLARLPALKPEEGDTVDFKLRDRSLPPPRAGETIQAAFALPATSAPPPPIKTTAPLEVTRFTPEGEVAIAPMLSVTFSQPMVAVSSQNEAAANVPVTLTPQPKGRWRWLGTQTLVFQPEAEGGRLPMATAYTLNIPAGTKSALGNALPVAKTFSFATPAPTLRTSHPQGQSQPRDPLMFLGFDQRIDAAKVFASLKLQPTIPGLQLRLATAEEIKADKSISELAKQAPEGRWLVVRAVGADGSTKNALPSDTNISVTLPAGTPSAEGPRVTAKDQSFGFKTFGPLRVVETQCGYQKRCSPFDSMFLAFSNQLDTDSFQPGQVKVTPEIPGAKITASYNRIQIEGFKRSSTTYTVTLDRGIKDNFGQKLSGENQHTFKVSTAEPALFATGDGFVVLDPAGRRAFTVYSLNYSQLRVAIYKVTPDDWPQFRQYMGGRYRNTRDIPAPPGKLVSNTVVDVKGGRDQLIETAIDLSPGLDDGYGQVFVKVQPVERTEDKNKPVTVYANRSYKAEAWVQSTDIGLDAFADKNQLIAWANSLKDGRPLAGVEMSAAVDNLTGTTGPDGLAHLAFKPAPRPGPVKPVLLVARRGKDMAILPQNFNSYYFNPNEGGSWRRADSRDSLSWYVIDDRKLYRPGEEVSLKGWIRKIDLTPAGGTEMFSSAGETVKYVLKDSQNNEITKGSVKLNALAGFDFKLSLPATMNLGGATVEFELAENGGSHSHNFQVQEFRRPEFEITARASEAPHFVGSFATATMTAAYYSGGPLAGTDVDWTVTSRPTNYTPPNRDDYTFGKFYAWWRNDDQNEETNEESFKGRTDADGKHTLRMDFDGVDPARPSSVTAEARVQDVNRQTLAAMTTLLIHPADVYVGLKSARSFVQKGQPFDVATIVTDLDGKAVSGREVRLRLVRLEYVHSKGEWKLEEKDPQEQTLTSGTDAVSARFQTKEGGMYRLTGRVRDDRERLNESELSLWVAGGKLPPKREVEQEKVELIPDRRNYAGNSVAEILVQSPFAPAEGVLTIRRSGVLRTERFTMPENSYTLRIPIEEAMMPNVFVQVDLVGSAVRVDDAGNALTALPKRPAFASGEIKLDIETSARRLSVTAKPRQAVLQPGAETMVDVEVKDANGKSVAGTDTAVIVVDESVLALTNYKLTDPLSVF